MGDGNSEFKKKIRAVFAPNNSSQNAQNECSAIILSSARFSNSANAFKEWDEKSKMLFPHTKIPPKETSSWFQQDEESFDGNKIGEEPEGKMHAKQISYPQQQRFYQEKGTNRNFTISYPQQQRFYQEKETNRNFAKSYPQQQRSYKEKGTNRNFKTEEQERIGAEERVKEVFERSRHFKPFTFSDDIVGSGVDTFKCNRVIRSLTKGEDVPEVDDSSSAHYIPDFPATGLVANFKPLARGDMLKDPEIPLTEVWDEDFSF